MKKLVKFFTLFLSLTVLVCLAGCKKPAQYTAQQMADAIQFANDKKEVTFQFAVDKQVERLYEGSETEKQVAPITWTSDDTRVSIKDYIVKLNYDANNEAPAKIKGEVEVNGEKASQEFQIRILKENTYEEFMNMEKGKAVSVSGYVSYLGEYSASYKNFTMQVVAKDKQHSYYAYRASCDAATYKQLSVGQLVGLTGEADEYNGKQLAKAKVSVLSGDKFTESAVELPEADLKKSENLNKLVKVTAEVTGSPVDDNGSYRVEAKVGNTEVQIQNNKYFYESGSAAGEAVKNKILGLKPADTVVLEGYLGAFKETPTFTVVKPDTMQVTAGDPDKAAVGIAKGNVEKALKDADLTKAGEITFTLPEGVTAEITLDNNDQQVVKVVDGKLVLAPIATETKVNVTIKLTKGSQTAEVKKELTVVLPQVQPEKPATVDVTEEGKAKKNMTIDGTNNAKYIGLDETKWNVTGTNNYEGSTLGIGLYDTMRLYTDKDGKVGHKLTLTNLEGKKVEYVVLSFKFDPKKVPDKVAVNGVDYVLTADTQELVVKLDTPSSEVVIHANGLKGQVRFTKIDLTFAK